MVLDSKVFRVADQQAFAELSGDSNPMHMDSVYARRTLFGQPVVHGIHVVLWALDGYLRRRAAPVSLAGVNARFRRSVPVGTVARVVLRREEKDSVQLAVEADDGREATELEFEFSSIELPCPAMPDKNHAVPCPDLSFAEAAACAGALPLIVDLAQLERLLPNLANNLPAVQCAELLATTRLVGMVCPGLHSLFSALKMTAADGGAPELGYRVRRSHPKTGGLDLAVSGPTLAGVLNTFMRPRPQAQPSMSDIAKEIQGKPFAGQCALVVGGSRGLGEVTAKCIAVGGGSVVITYLKGEEDAKRLVAEITAAGGIARAIRMDCTEQLGLAGLSLASQLDQWGPPTHLYFFATPLIPVDTKRVFSGTIYRDLARYYVEGFGELVQTVHGLSSGVLKVLYPSTVFLDEPQPGTGEYCAAKAAGEALCRHLEVVLTNTQFYTPRLPRMRTDQTVGILPVKSHEAVEVMAEFLRRMK